ncbi:MAG TPA: hypothetical protein VIJ75_04875, partial [Hanamia sp.]
WEDPINEFGKNVRYYPITVTEVTDEIINTGIVLVYLRVPSTNILPSLLPQTFYSFTQTGNQYMGFNLLTGQIKIKFFNVFDLSTHAQKWIYNNNGGNQKAWQPGPVAAHGMMVTDRGDNMLKTFYASTGKLMWTFTPVGLVNTYACIVDFGGKAFYTGAAGNMN